MSRVSLKHWLIIILFTLLSTSQEAIANIPKGEFQFQKDQPVHIESDQVYYDKARELVYSSGNVVIWQQDQIIYADNAYFLRNENDIYANGNVAIVKEGGDIYFGDEIRFNRDSYKGVVLNFKARIPPHSTFSSTLAQMESRDLIKLREFVYSPCSICEENIFSNNPLWQIKADGAVIDKQDESITYSNARIDVLDFPVFYSPYFQTPTPGAKRKSGFLRPIINKNSNYGVSVEIPFYFNISPDMDATVGVKISQRKEPILSFEHRKRFRNGSTQLNILATRANKLNKLGQDKHNDPRLHGKGIRLYGKARALFFFNKQEFLPGTLYFGSRFIEDKPRTFNRVLGIDVGNPILTTELNYTSYKIDYFARARALHFRDIRNYGERMSLKTTAQVMPNFALEKNFNLLPEILDGKYIFDYTNLVKNQGSAYQRLSNHLEVGNNHIFNSGLVFNNRVFTRGDLYKVTFNRFNDPAKSQKAVNNTGNEAKAYVDYMSELKYPVYNSIAGHTVILEPTVQGIIGPNSQPLSKVISEDSQDPVLTYTNLFSHNRFKGFDRFESGKRANYGLLGNIKSSWFHNLNFVLGQTIREKAIKENDSTYLTKFSGLSTHRSDYVTKIALQPIEYFYINNASRFDSSSKKLNKNEIWFSYEGKKLTIQILHEYLNKNQLGNTDQFRQEIYNVNRYTFFRQWWIQSEIRSKIGKKRQKYRTPLITTGLSLGYTDECITANIRILKNHQADKDVSRSTTYSLNIDVPVF